MATLIKVKTKSGKVHRCDVRCYNAKCSKCVCICSGKNHGVGLKQAVKNTMDLAIADLEEIWEDYLKEKEFLRRERIILKKKIERESNAKT